MKALIVFIYYILLHLKFFTFIKITFKYSHNISIINLLLDVLASFKYGKIKKLF